MLLRRHLRGQHAHAQLGEARRVARQTAAQHLAIQLVRRRTANCARRALALCVQRCRPAAAHGWRARALRVRRCTCRPAAAHCPLLAAPVSSLFPMPACLPGRPPARFQPRRPAFQQHGHCCCVRAPGGPASPAGTPNAAAGGWPSPGPRPRGARGQRRTAGGGAPRRLPLPGSRGSPVRPRALCVGGPTSPDSRGRLIQFGPIEQCAARRELVRARSRRSARPPQSGATRPPPTRSA